MGMPVFEAISFLFQIAALQSLSRRKLASRFFQSPLKTRRLFPKNKPDFHRLFTTIVSIRPDIQCESANVQSVKKIGISVMTKILLAEDDNDMRRFLVKALDNAGYQVVSYDNGASAYDRLREEPFNLLLTDIVMPEMDGIELARRATEIDPDLKVMFITGFAAVALNADSKAPKDAKVLSKPFHLRDLVNEVEKMLTAA